MVAAAKKLMFIIFHLVQMGSPVPRRLPSRRDIEGVLFHLSERRARPLFFVTVNPNYSTIASLDALRYTTPRHAALTPTCERTPSVSESNQPLDCEHALCRKKQL